MPAFAGPRVVDINLETGGTVPETPDDAADGALFGIVRLHQVPLGYFETRLTTPFDRTALVRAALDHCEDAVLRHLLVDALISGQFARLPAERALVEAEHATARASPAFTIAVCTRDRPTELSRCLAALAALDYPDLQVLVVDNAPSSDESERIVKSRGPALRYLLEPRPGISHARNRAIAETRTDILGFVDDDVVIDRSWARAMATVLSEAPDVMAVTGLVAPYELETRAQLDFERHLGWTRRFERRWFRRRAGEPIGERLANAVKMGTGANMAFRREVFDEIGRFDPALGTGTAARGGEDLDMFLRVLRAGHTLVYEPAALVRHRHRQEARALRQQLAGWASGMTAYLVRNMREHPDERRRLAGFLARLLAIYYPRRVAQSLVSRHLRLGLTGAEFAGAIAGLGRYRGAGGRDLRNVNDTRSASARVARERTQRSADTVTVDLADPLPPVVSGTAGLDRIRLDVRRAGRPLGAVDVFCGGRPLSRLRASDAIAAGLWRPLVRPSGSLGGALQAMLGLSEAVNSRRAPGPGY